MVLATARTLVSSLRARFGPAAAAAPAVPAPQASPQAAPEPAPAPVYPPLRDISEIAIPDEAHERYLVQHEPYLFDCDPARRVLFQSLWNEYREKHGQPWDPTRILQLMFLMEAANKAGDGDYIELGTHRGLFARVIWRLMDQTRHLYLLDTFEGFVQRDLDVENKLYANHWEVGNFLPTSPEMVCDYVGGGTPPANVTAIKGWFPDSFRGLEKRRWRFVHIDFDLYQPIKSAMELCWPRLMPGGVMIIHDYGCLGFPGAKIAVDEFFDRVGMVPQHLGDRWGSVAVVKPRTAPIPA